MFVEDRVICTWWNITMTDSDLGTGTSICYSVCVILELILFIIKQWWNSNSLEIFKEFWWKFWLLRWGIPPRFFFNKWTWLIDLNSDMLMEGFTNQERSGCMITEMFNKWGCLALEIKFSKRGRSVVGLTPWMTLCWFGGMLVDYWSYFCLESVLRLTCQIPGQLWVYSVEVSMILFCSMRLDFFYGYVYPWWESTLNIRTLMQDYHCILSRYIMKWQILYISDKRLISLLLYLTDLYIFTILIIIIFIFNS